MENDLQICPGNSLSSFLRIMSFDLKWRKIEYLVIAYFDKNEFPIAMRQIAGRTSWVAYSVGNIITEAKALNAISICLVHNHPASYDEKPSLKPSSEDISFQQQFLAACQTNQLIYLGDWISSKGQLTEVLYYTWEEAIRTQYAYREDELLKVNYALTPTFIATVQPLTKPSITVVDEYNIGMITVELDKLQPKANDVGILNISVMSTYSLHTPKSCIYQMKLLVLADMGNNIVKEILSLEEVTRACYVIFELYEESKVLLNQKYESKRITLSITENCILGISQQESEQTAFISVRGQNYLFRNLNEIEQLHLFFDKALKHLESLSNN